MLMKKLFLAVLFVGISIVSYAQVASSEKPYNWALGIRASRSPSITAKHFVSPKSAFDLDLGFIDLLKVGGTLAYEYNIKISEKGHLYLGPLAQLAAFVISDADADHSPLTLGAGGVFGIEWVITKSFAVSLDTRHLCVYSEGSGSDTFTIEGSGFTEGLTYDYNLLALGLKWHF